VVFLSTGGNQVRIRLSNAFGTQAVQVAHATVAVNATGASAVPGSVRTLTFGGSQAVTLIAGGDALSDPVNLRVAPLSDALVSVYLPGPTGPLTNHPFTAQGNFLGSGDLAGSVSGAGFGFTPCWMVVSGVDVRSAPRVAGTVVALGDSITDTANTTGNANRRWPDDLSRRLNARPGPTLSVVKVIVQAHARGLRIYGATITAFGGSIIEAPGREQTRLDVNHWIMTSHAFDGVIDLAAAVADPANPAALLPAFDSGDHLHPNEAGCQAMADAVNLPMLTGGR
jgi:hypothetical protein